MALTPRQQRFVELYHATGLGAQSYIEAYGATSKGYAAQNAYRILRIPAVKEELEKLRGESLALANITREEIVDYLIAAITTPVAEIDETSPLAQEVKRASSPNGSETIEVKAVSKIAALRELARITGIIKPEEVRVSASDDVVNALRGICGVRKDG